MFLHEVNLGFRFHGCSDLTCVLTCATAPSSALPVDDWGLDGLPDIFCARCAARYAHILFSLNTVDSSHVAHFGFGCVAVAPFWGICCLRAFGLGLREELLELSLELVVPPEALLLAGLFPLELRGLLVDSRRAVDAFGATRPTASTLLRSPSKPAAGRGLALSSWPPARCWFHPHERCCSQFQERWTSLKYVGCWLEHCQAACL